jgi:L-ascorbate metabolism protein UlaG (beta-lactamase superfamily)
MQTDLAAQRRAEIEEKRKTSQAEYYSVWRRLTREWRTCKGGDSLWLTYSANYLLHTAGVKWAIDPFSLLTRFGGENHLDFAKDLQGLQLVVLSHTHSDHLDLNLISALRDFPITWIVPSFMLERVTQTAELPRERILVPQIGEPIQFGKLTIIPFEGLHFWGSNGVPELSYLAEFSGKRWLFPGDVRSFDSQRLSKFGHIDGVFAHLCLGSRNALNDDPPWLNSFCKFYTDIKPEKIIVTHLEEIGRDAEDYWTLDHYQQARSKIQEISKKMFITYSLTGQRVEL